MIDKPYDLAVIFGLFALVVATVGFGIANINDIVTVPHNDTFFTSVTQNANSSTGLKGSGDIAADGLTGTDGGEAATQESFILKGINSLLTLGQTFNLVKTSINEGEGALNIPHIYFTIITSLLILAFAVTVYTWIRA